MEGWIKLHRKFNDWEWRSSPKHVAVFLDLLLNANHKSKNYRGIIIKPGQLTTSYDAISKRTGVSIQSVRTVLRDLKSTHELTHESFKHYSLISILKWDQHQVATHEPTSYQQPPNNLLTTNKNVKNVKNVKNTKVSGSNVITLWNNACDVYGLMRKAKSLSRERSTMISECLDADIELQTLQGWVTYFEKINKSDFLSGKKTGNWKASFDWAINKNNLLKVSEGNYEVEKDWIQKELEQITKGNQ